MVVVNVNYSHEVGFCSDCATCESIICCCIQTSKILAQLCPVCSFWPYIDWVFYWFDVHRKGLRRNTAFYMYKKTYLLAIGYLSCKWYFVE